MINTLSQISSSLLSTRKALAKNRSHLHIFQTPQPLPMVWLSGPTNHNNSLSKVTLFRIKSSENTLTDTKNKNQSHICLCRYQSYNSSLHQILLNLFEVLDITDSDQGTHFTSQNTQGTIWTLERGIE